MKFKQYIVESKPTMKLKSVNGMKVRIIEGYKNYKRLYVVKNKKQKAYYISTNYPAKSLDDMIDIDGEYWFGTLKEIKGKLNI